MSGTYTLRDAVTKVIQDRRSTRNYTQEPVSDEDLDSILEAGRLAPSGVNVQPWRFVVVRDVETRRSMAALAGGGADRRFTAEFASEKMQDRFAGLQDEEKKKAVFEKLVSGQVSVFISAAPVNIVVCGSKDAWNTLSDVAAAVENMLLMGTALGLGTCWVSAPCDDIRDEERLKALLGIPEEFKAVHIVAIGHPARTHRARPRLPIHELVFSEKWGMPRYSEEK